MHLEGSVWLFRVAELFSYNFQTILHFADAATSLLPAKPDCQSGKSEHFTATSLLPAKPDQPLPSGSQRSHSTREVRVSMSEQ